MKAIAWLVGIGTFLVALIYTAVSLNRWEWNRALFFGLIALMAQVGLSTALILKKLSSSVQNYDRAVLDTIRATRPPAVNRFEWLQESVNRTNVFITFFVGGGVLLSALAWVVDKLATNTSTPAGEVKIAQSLDSISYPQGGLLVDDITALAQDSPGDLDRQLQMMLRRDKMRRS